MERNSRPLLRRKRRRTGAFRIPNSAGATVSFPVFSPKSLAGEASQNLTPMTLQQGNVKGETDEIVHGFTTGENPTERGLIVKTSNFLLIKVSVSNTSSNRIYDYTTLRNHATLTDNKGNNYRRIDSNQTVEEYEKVTDGWVAPYPFRDNF